MVFPQLQSHLLTLPNLYTTQSQKDPICAIKLFLPNSFWSWYIIEFSHENRDICFGYVIGLESELGYFSLKELNSLTHCNSKVEIDTSFEPLKLSEVKRVSNETF